MFGQAVLTKARPNGGARGGLAHIGWGIIMPVGFRKSAVEIVKYNSCEPILVQNSKFVDKKVFS